MKVPATAPKNPSLNPSLNPEGVGLYVHVPFCRSKCAYCDFYSLVSPERMSEWLDAVIDELAEAPAFLKAEKPLLRSVYVGGGTPSLLSASHFERLFRRLESICTLLPGAEITLEANPDDLHPEYLRALRDLPFNRISMGVQSFDDAVLTRIRRRHSADDARRAVEACVQSGYTNLSVDLMYGLPGQSFDSFAASIDAALALPVTHISSYALSWEEGAAWYSRFQKGELHAASDEHMEACFFRLKDQLEAAGFQQYELSNFAREGYMARHNAAYWDGTPYLGIGPSAHSFDGSRRRCNPSSLTAYLNGLRSGATFREEEVLDEAARYNEFVFTRLRTLKGLDLDALRTAFGREKWTYCLQNAALSLSNGTLERAEGYLRLTRKGLFVSNAVFADLMWV
jgi:oxygen-independent coproporphyrinogen-3 oxidase